MELWRESGIHWLTSSFSICAAGQTKYILFIVREMREQEANLEHIDFDMVTHQLVFICL
jgi:hypothetical protein